MELRREDFHLGGGSLSKALLSDGKSEDGVRARRLLVHIRRGDCSVESAAAEDLQGLFLDEMGEEGELTC